MHQLYQIARLKYKLFYLITLCMTASTGQAQTPADTSKLIQIVSGNRMRQNQIDSNTTLLTLAGKAIVRQGNTIIHGDSIAVNQATGIAEVFGHVHINDADSVHSYADYLLYKRDEKIAYLKRNVRLTDGRGNLTTNDLEYNLTTGIAKYKDGGKVINGSTVLTSADAVYFSDTKDVYFKKFVHLTDPDYDIKADSLLYNTAFKTATFIAPTRIVTRDGGIINTSDGTYNLETREAIFFDRTSYADSIRSLSGNNIAYDEKSGQLQVEGNGKIVDSVNNVIVLGNMILLDKFKNSFLATRKPIMIFYKGNDSTYIAADTLFSGLRMHDSIKNTSIVRIDTASNEMRIDLNKPDTSFKTIDQPIDTNNLLNNAIPDSLKNNSEQDSLKINLPPEATATTNDSIRYFLAFHHVKIYNDSLQAVSDSLYYSTEDSVFRLFQEPVVWSGKSQVTGDTMYLFSQNQKPQRLFVFNDAMVINEDRPGLYNQVSGRTLNAYFLDGKIDYVRIKGSPSESVYYVKDEDSAYVGMNRSSSDVIDVFFKNDELIKIIFIKDVNGTLYPMQQIPNDKINLRGFEWQDARRPKHYLELFE